MQISGLTALNSKACNDLTKYTQRLEKLLKRKALRKTLLGSKRQGHKLYFEGQNNVHQSDRMFEG